MIDPLTALTRQAEGLWMAVSPHLPGFTVEVVPSIDSTNTELMRRARAGQHAPVLLVALEQTAGRGRRGRTWHSRPGDSLTFSLGLPLAPADWSGLSLAVGISLAEQLHRDIRLKWPNDLWWQGRKVGGILVETASIGTQRYAVIGVGLNLATPELPAEPVNSTDPALPIPAVAPVGLNELPDVSPNRDAGVWLANVLSWLVLDLLDFQRLGFAPFAQRFESRDALRGLEVHLSDGRRGVADGITPQGAMRLQTPDGMAEINTAEVSVRPC